MKLRQEKPKQQPKQRLRKQPRMRRVQTASAVPLPSLTPEARTARKTAQKRKRRNSQERFRRPVAGALAFVLNARWISLAILALCAYTLYTIGSDDRFYLNTIPVEGASSLDINHVVAESGLAGRHMAHITPAVMTAGLAIISCLSSAVFLYSMNPAGLDEVWLGVRSTVLVQAGLDAAVGAGLYLLFRQRWSDDRMVTEGAL